MNQLVQLVQGNPLPLIGALVLFFYVGHGAVGSKQHLRNWGWRLAFVVFVTYVAYDLSLNGVADPGVLVAASFRGFLAGGLTLGISWIALTIAHVIFGTFFSSVAQPLRRIKNRRERRQWEQDRQRAEQDRQLHERERVMVEREKERQRERQKQEHEQQAREGAKRRQNARYECERFYDRHRVRLANKFPQNRLEEYFERYLGDEHTADEVERRVEQLKGTLQELLDQEETNGKKPRYKSIDEINKDFDQQREAIARSNFNGERIGNLIANVELAARHNHPKVPSEMNPIQLGSDLQTDETVYLDPDMFRTHMHLVGATGTGKSTVLQTILQQLVTQTGFDKCSLFLIDPIGNLSQDLLRFLAHPVFSTDYIRERLVYIEPSNDQYVIPFNPLFCQTEAARYYQVMRAVDIVLRAWDAQEVRQQPRLLQWTFKAFCAAAMLGFPIAICRYLVHPRTPEHAALMARIPGDIRYHWEEILNARGGEATRILESTKNRLDPFFNSDHLRRMFGTRRSLFNCEQFIRERKIVILNLGKYGRLASFIADTIGGLALNEILETASALSTAKGRAAVDPTYIVMDEFQRFVGSDVEQALPTVRQMGLRLILAHQSFSQLEREDVDLTNMIWQARSRLIFANSAGDADILANEVAKLTFNNMTIKDQRTSLKQLIVGYRKEWLESQSATKTRSNAEMEQKAIGYNMNRGESLGPTQMRPTKSQGRGDQHNRSTGQTWAASNAETTGRSQANVPIHEFVDEVSNITYLSFDEWELKWGKDIRRLNTGDALALFPNDPDVHSVHVDEFAIEPTAAAKRAVDELLDRNYDSGFFITAAEADRELEECRRMLLTTPPIILPDQSSPPTVEGPDEASGPPPADEPGFR